MTSRQGTLRALCAALCIAMLVPAGALAHDGFGGRDGRHHFHHRLVFLKGTVKSVDPGDKTLVLAVTSASRGGKALVGDDVVVKALAGWVADTNNDGTHSLADVQAGDTVIVVTKRRFVDADHNAVSAAKVFDKTHPGPARTRASAGDGDGHHCDHF